MDVHEGWGHVKPRVVRGKRAPHADLPPPFDQFSTHEIDVLRCRCHGFSNPQVAAHFFVHDKTVRNVLTAVYRKLGLATLAGTRGGAACYLLGLLDAKEGL